MGKVKAKLDEGAIVRTIFIYVVHITSIQIFSPFIAIFPRLQHQFCHERTLILQQYCSTVLTPWRFYDWRQRLLE